MTGRSLSSCSIVCVGIGELFTANTHTHTLKFEEKDVLSSIGQQRLVD